MDKSRTILVTGAQGRLGAALVRCWQAQGYAVVGLGRREFDLSWEVPQMRSALSRYDFDVLVNCAAQTNVDRCETNEEEAFQLNAEAPTVLGDICRTRNARMVHVSTDYVFAGDREEPYGESDSAQPVSLYGAAKRAGEAGVLTVTEGRGLVVRVSWVFGPDRPSFVDQIVQRAQREVKVAAVADKVATPTYTLDAARYLEPLLFAHPVGGVVHLCNGGACTWQEYGQHALDSVKEAGLTLQTDRVEPLLMADLKAFVAQRPRYSAMRTDKLAELIGERPRPWQEAVSEYLRGQVQRGAFPPPSEPA